MRRLLIALALCALWFAVPKAQTICCKKTTAVEGNWPDDQGGVVIADWSSPGAARAQSPANYTTTFGWPASVGAFTIPAPYNVDAYRLTQATDCTGSADCVRQTSYSNLNMISSCGLQQGAGCTTTLSGILTLGGQGLYRWDIDLVTNIRTLTQVFEDGDRLDNANGVTDVWSMSLSEANILFASSRNDGEILRCDISVNLLPLDSESADCTVLWDAQSLSNRTAAAAAFGLTAGQLVNVQVWSIYFDYSGDNFTFYLQDGSLGFIGNVFVRSGTAYYAAGVGDSGIDLSGRYGWWAAQHAPCASLPGGAAGPDQFIRDFVGATTTVGCDQDGFVGHQGAGWGYLLQEDNWAPNGQELLMIDLANIPANGNDSGPTVFYNVEFGNSYVQPSFLTGQSTSVRPLNQQQVCTTTTTDPIETWAFEREIVCFYPGADGALVVAPTMARMDLSGSGGLEGDLDYYKAPKCPMSSDGRWILCGANGPGSTRLDLFLVRIPRENIPAATAPSSLFRPRPLSLMSPWALLLSFLN